MKFSSVFCLVFVPVWVGCAHSVPLLLLCNDLIWQTFLADVLKQSSDDCTCYSNRPGHRVNSTVQNRRTKTSWKSSCAICLSNSLCSVYNSVCYICYRALRGTERRGLPAPWEHMLNKRVILWAACCRFSPKLECFDVCSLSFKLHCTEKLCQQSIQILQSIRKPVSNSTHAIYIIVG